MDSVGFDNHALMAFTSEPEKLIGKKHNKNNLEKIGGIFNWCVTELPKKIIPAFFNPKVLAVAFTALALVAVQFSFYPITSFLATKAICVFVVKHTPLFVLKISLYVFTQINVLGFGMTALGRFSNKELMNEWYYKGYQIEITVPNTELIDGKPDFEIVTEQNYVDSK